MLLELDSTAPFGSGIVPNSDPAWTPVAVAAGERGVATVGVGDAASAARVKVAVGAVVDVATGVGERVCVGSGVGWVGSAVGLRAGWSEEVAVDWAILGLATGVMVGVGRGALHAASSNTNTTTMMR